MPPKSSASPPTPSRPAVAGCESNSTVTEAGPATRALRGQADAGLRQQPADRKQQARLEGLFAVEKHAEVEAISGILQRMIAADNDHDRRRGRTAMAALIDSVTQDVPAALVQLRRLVRTLKQPATDLLAYFDRPHTSNGPTEAMNGRLEHL